MLILAAILAIFVYGIIAAMLGTIMPTFNLTMVENGNIALAQALGLVIASIAVGPIIDNRGKKTALIAGLAVVSAVLWALPSSTTFGERLFLIFGLGLGGGIIVTGANALASDVNEARRASTLNFLNLFFGLGGLVTPLLAANLFGGDVRQLCYFGAAIGTITLIVHIVTKMPPPNGERGFKMAELGHILSSPALYLLALFLFLYVACEVGVWNWLQTYLISRGIDKSKALNILSLGFALGLLIGRVVVSRILINVKPSTVTLASAGLMAVTTYLILGTTDPTIAWIGVFCAGLAMAPVFPTTLAMVADAFPKATGTAMGLVITCGWLGLAVSSPIIGSLAGKDSANLGTALLLLPAAAVVMVFTNIALRMRKA